jgi:hypothetical protein
VPPSVPALTKFTIDHIAPQSLGGEWPTTLEFTNADEKDEILNSWGSLAPLSSAANSSKGSSSWDSARGKLGHETIYSTTKTMLPSHEKWNQKTIQARTAKLIDWAIERWPE